MQPLSLLMLGPFSATWENQSLKFATNTARALLAYLAIEAERPIARSQLANLLWPEQPSDVGFNNLRQTLMRVRKALPDPANANSLLFVTRGTIQFNREVAASDVFRFEDLLAECALHVHDGIVSCASCVNRLQEAVSLYRGEFLSGLLLDNCQPFEEWMLFKRERLHRQVLEALGMLAIHYEAKGQFEAMRHCAARQLALEAWHEEAHAQMMRALAYMGDRTAALAQYETCRQLIQSEFGIEPDRELRELAERIRAGTLARPETSATALAPQTVTSDWQHIPESGVLFGRARDLESLNQWLVQERSRLVWIFGIGGVGKTSLAAAATNTAAPNFDVVFWRSLLNAPPIEEVLRAAVQVLSQHPSIEFPSDLDGQLALLLDLLRQTRCLMVLDNLESILQAGESDTYRPGYEAYDQLIRTVAQNRHRSCLLMTSREQPRETARLNGNEGVHALRLTGLSPDAGRAMLATFHLGDEATEANTLVRRYSGNPLALKLVAQTVQELFMGSIGDFLSAEAPIFDDVRTVLDQQFERLSPIQLEMLTWLAVAREATPLSTLRESLLQPLTPREFLEALRALQRRSLLEQAIGGDASTPAAQTSAVMIGGGVAFTLQNVIMEYVTDRLIDAVCREVEAGQLHTLTRHALIQARAKEYVLQSQIRQILMPIADRLASALGKVELERRFATLLAQLHALPPHLQGYAAGNILNLALQLGFDTAHYDFSGLNVWQADLRRARFATLDFHQADLTDSTFIQALDVGAVKFVDATRMLVAGIDGSEICLWRTAEGQLQNAFRNPSYGGYPIVFSGDGRLLANSGLDHDVRVRSAESGALVQTLTGHTDQVFIPAFNQEGTLLASGGRDGTVHIWDVESGRELQVLSVAADNDLITGVAFSPDGTILAGGGSQHDLWLWDLHNGCRLIRKLHGHAREIECCAFSADGQILASGAHDGAIGIWDVATGQCLRLLQGHRQVVRVLAFHPHSRLLASGSADQTVRLWDPQRDELLQTLTGHTAEINTICFNPDGSVLASGGVDKTVRWWDVRTGQTLEILSSHATIVNSVQWRPATPLLASGSGDGVIRLWDVRDQTVRHLDTRHAAHVLALGFSPDGSRLASAGIDHTVREWDADTGRLIDVLHGHNGKVSSVAYHPDGRLLASGSSDRTIRLWAMDPNRRTQPRPSMSLLRGHEDEVVSVSFSPDGRTLLSSSLDHTARVWDVASGRQVGLLKGHTSALCGAIFTQDGRLILTNSWNYTVVAWDAATQQRVAIPGISSLRARGMAFSPDGRLLASAATREYAIELHTFQTGELLFALRGHVMTIRTLSFNSDGSLLASGSWDGEIRIWDTRLGTCVAALHAPGPYSGMNITGITGVSDAQKASLFALGATSDADATSGRRTTP